MKYSCKQLSSVSATALLLSVALIQPSYAATTNTADDAAEACKEAARLLQEDNDLDGALEEASWCMTGLQQLKEEIKLSLLPEELNGFIGGKIDNQTMMGMSIIERAYVKDDKTITITLTAASTGAGGLGALAELGKLFGAMENAGMSGTSKKIRIQKRTVIASDEGGTGKLNVELKSGGSLQAVSDDFHSDELTDFMRDFPIIAIDDVMSK